MSRHALQVLYGFLLTAALVLGPLMPPGAIFFLWLWPIWAVCIGILLLFGFLISGRYFYAVGVVMFLFAVALGILIMFSADARQTVKLNAISRELDEKCAIKMAPIKKPSTRHDLIILENVPTTGEQNYDIADLTAVLTGMRVIEMRRDGYDNRFGEAKETIPERSNSCAGSRDAFVDRSPRGSQRNVAPLAVNTCLARKKIPEPSTRGDAIIFRSISKAPIACMVIEIAERKESEEVVLGRVHYDQRRQRFHPDITQPKGIPKINWLLVLLSEVLQQDLSDKALMAHAVKIKK